MGAMLSLQQESKQSVRATVIQARQKGVSLKQTAFWITIKAFSSSELLNSLKMLNARKSAVHFQSVTVD